MAKVLIVGAGAAGLMAAGAAVRQGHQVTVLEHMDKPAQKILWHNRTPDNPRPPVLCRN